MGILFQYMYPYESKQLTNYNLRYHGCDSMNELVKHSTSKQDKYFPCNHDNCYHGNHGNRENTHFFTSKHIFGPGAITSQGLHEIRLYQGISNLQYYLGNIWVYLLKFMHFCKDFQLQTPISPKQQTKLAMPQHSLIKDIKMY